MVRIPMDTREAEASLVYTERTLHYLLILTKANCYLLASALAFHRISILYVLTFSKESR